jgi:hypothetical protein
MNAVDANSSPAACRQFTFSAPGLQLPEAEFYFLLFDHQNSNRTSVEIT